MVTYYAQRASAGIIVTEATQVAPEGLGYPCTPGIHNDAHVAAWRPITQAVHDRGGLIVLQLWHVGRISHSSLQPGRKLPVAPSAIAPARGQAMTYEGPKPFETPRALTLQEIPEIVEQYANGAELAKAAGFDGVELHGANGYLVDQFLRDGTNKRTDDYGGSVQNRCRFLFEVTDALIKVWGPGRVGVRLSPNGTFNDMSDSDPRRTFEHAIRGLSDRRIAYLHFIELLNGDPGISVTAHDVRSWFQNTVVINGGYSLEKAEQVVNEGNADLVSFGVPFLANPDLPERFKTKAPLNTPDQSTFYGGNEKGYIDYPALVDSNG
jgi:N-ethylmaleimide reductase